MINENNLPHLPFRESVNPHIERIVQRESYTELQLKNMIRDMGLKVTQQRLAILRALNEGRVHVTVQEVFEVVSQTHSDVGFATVYRFLKKLKIKQHVTEVRMGGGAARYELASKTHHDHLTCVGCGLIIEFEDAEIETKQNVVAEKFGFNLTHHVHELYGVCNRCQKNP